MEEVAKRTLREWRAKRNLNKQAMSKKLGVHASTYARWEKNPEEISIGEAIRISEALECRVRDIIFFESNPNFNLGLPERIL
jgi:DNA-binding XRE family transcriptional regulator